MQFQYNCYTCFIINSRTKCTTRKKIVVNNEITETNWEGKWGIVALQQMNNFQLYNAVYMLHCEEMIMLSSLYLTNTLRCSFIVTAH